MNKGFAIQVIFDNRTKCVRHVLHNEVKKSVLF